VGTGKEKGKAVPSKGSGPVKLVEIRVRKGGLPALAACLELGKTIRDQGGGEFLLVREMDESRAPRLGRL